MVNCRPSRILTINAGSSSLKAALYDMDRTERLMFACPGRADRSIGQSDADRRRRRRHAPRPNRRSRHHETAARAFLEWLHHRSRGRPERRRASHRARRTRASRAARPDERTSLADLQELVPLDPDHLPQALAVIQVTTETYPAIPQVACFDTAFHRSMPRVAQMYPLPPTIR